VVFVTVIGIAAAIGAGEIRPAIDSWPVRGADCGPIGSFVKVTDVGDPVMLTVLDETVSSGQIGGLRTLIGQVRNDSDEVVVLDRLEAAAFDSDSALVAVATGRLYGNAVAPEPVVGTAEGLAPGAVAAFTISMFAPEDDVDAVMIRASGHAADVEIADPVLEATTDWEIEESPYGIVTASRVVRNVSGHDVVGVSATVVLTDPDGTVFAVERVYPSGEVVGGYSGGVRAGEELTVSLAFEAGRDRIEQAGWDVRFSGRTYDGGSFRYGVVGVAHTVGVNGSVWRSSLTLTNRSGAAAAVRLRYFEGNLSADATLEIADGETIHRDDVVRTLFGAPGSSVGSVQVSSSAPLTVAGRTVNRMPAGTFGQALPVYTPTMTIDLMGGGVLTGLRGGPAFRTNVGLVNMSDRDCTCRVELYDRDGAVLLVRPAVEVGATSWRQLNDIVPPAVDVAHAVVEPDGCLMWSYASVIESSSGDPTTVDVELRRVVDLTPAQFRRPGIIMGSWADLPAPEPPAP
jgi:hypothetical protein